MNRDLLASMTCPYTRSPFTVERVLVEDDEGILFGIVSSDFGKFPILDGILRLLVDEFCGPAVRRLEEGDTDAALYISMEVPFHDRRGALVNLLSRLAHAAGSERAVKLIGLSKYGMVRSFRASRDTFVDLAARVGTRKWADRECFRFSMRTFLPVYPLMHCLDDSEAILDFGAGLGHDAFLIARMYPHVPLTCVDRSFSALYLGKKYFVKRANFICLDGNHLLPFQDGTFSAAFSSDALQYIDAKRAVMRELRRVAGANGTVVLAHLASQSGGNVSGHPLNRGGYGRLFGEEQAVLMTENELVRQYFCEDRMDLRPAAWREGPEDSGDLSMVASARGDVFRPYHGLFSLHLARMRNPVLNPVYSLSADGTTAKKRQIDPYYAGEMRWDESVLLPDRPQWPEAVVNASGLAGLKDRRPDVFQLLASRLVVIEAPEEFLSTDQQGSKPISAVSRNERRAIG